VRRTDDQDDGERSAEACGVGERGGSGTRSIMGNDGDTRGDEVSSKCCGGRMQRVGRDDGLVFQWAEAGLHGRSGELGRGRSCSFSQGHSRFTSPSSTSSSSTHRTA
jgi:hypothetical protein